MIFTQALVAMTTAETDVSTATDGNTTDMGFLMPVVIPIIAILVLWIGLGYLWNNKHRPRQLKNDRPTATFNHILKRVFRFLFKEDKVPSPKIKNPILAKIFVWRTFYLVCIITTVAMAIMKTAFLVPLIVLFIVAFTRTSNVFRRRHSILMRMFDVASVGLGYPRDAPSNPWTWVNIKKWEDMTTPGETVIRFPAKFKSGEIKNRESFENHFSSTVTDGNSWIFTWKSADSAVLLSPVTHIPELIKYHGSEHAEWDKIPVGMGSNGEVIWDLGVAPHALISGTTGSGKNLMLKTSVLTSRGWSTIGELKVGDTIYDSHGKPTQVTHLHPIITPDKAYEITFRNGEKITVDADHLWETETRIARISRFDNVKNESGRSRGFWLGQDVVAKLQKELAKTDSNGTISIPEMAQLTGKSPETGTFYAIAKIIGPAEEVRPKVKFHYNAQVVKQKQTVTYVDSAEFMELYNSRTVVERKNMPISQNQYDKLRDLNNELRDSDVMDVEGIIEYIGARKTTSDWVRKNFEASLPLKESIADLTEKAFTVKTVFPDKVFSIDKPEINALEFATLIDTEYNRTVRSTFRTIANKAKSKVTCKEEVELIVPEKVIERLGNPYVTYPKQLFLERILEWNSTPVNDQRHKRETTSIKTTQELFDTLWADENKTHQNHSIKKTPAIDFPERDLPIAPYSLGAWLGDETSSNGNICGIDHQVFKKIVADCSPKNIPAEYFISSIEQRRELLRGLLDTDGTVNKIGTVQLATSIPQLRDDVKRLVASLGYIPFVTQKEPTYVHNGEKKTGKTAYTISFFANPQDRLFHLDHKNASHEERFNANGGNSLIENHYIVDIKEVDSVKMRCISVDSPSRLFAVSDSMIPTHNSVLQRNLIFHCIQHPDKWRFLGIDVKMVELTPYLKYDPVVMGIATNVEDGVELVRYANEEMQNRYKMMTEAGVANFRDLPNMPHALMLMIDESYAFLATTGNKTDDGKAKDALKGEASAAIGDIARLGRAAGVHLVMATQRPDAVVIYGELKQNLAARFAAGRADTIASQMTLDNDQATRLPSIRGRGYLQINGQGEQFQGYYAEQSWIDDWLNKENQEELEVQPVNLEKEPATKNKKEGKDKKKGGGFLSKIAKKSDKSKDDANANMESSGIDLSKEEIFIDPLEQIPDDTMSNNELSKLANEFNDIDDEEYGNGLFDDNEEDVDLGEGYADNIQPVEDNSIPETISEQVSSLPQMEPELDSIFDSLDDDNSYASVFNSPTAPNEQKSSEVNPFGNFEDDFDPFESTKDEPKAMSGIAKTEVKVQREEKPAVKEETDSLDDFSGVFGIELDPFAIPTYEEIKKKPKVAPTKVSPTSPTPSVTPAPKASSLPPRPSLPKRPVRPEM